MSQYLPKIKTITIAKEFVFTALSSLGSVLHPSEELKYALSVDLNKESSDSSQYLRWSFNIPSI